MHRNVLSLALTELWESERTEKLFDRLNPFEIWFLIIVLNEITGEIAESQIGGWSVLHYLRRDIGC